MKINNIGCEGEEYYLYFGDKINNPKVYSFPYDIRKMPSFTYENAEDFSKKLFSQCYKDYDPLPDGRWEKLKCINKQHYLLGLKNIKNGLLDGVVVLYENDGIVRDSLFYRKGYKLGLNKRFYGNGEIASTSFFVDTCNSYLYYYGFYQNGKPFFFIRNGQIIDFYESGGLKTIGNENNKGGKEGEWLEFDSNGEIIRRTFYINGEVSNTEEF